MDAVPRMPALEADTLFFFFFYSTPQVNDCVIIFDNPDSGTLLKKNKHQLLDICEQKYIYIYIYKYREKWIIENTKAVLKRSE